MLMSYATTVEHRIAVRWMEEDFQTHPKIITMVVVVLLLLMLMVLLLSSS